MVPLMDVVLVLLVIFIVTAPMLTQAIKLDLPKVNAQPNQLKPDKIEFAIDGADQSLACRTVAETLADASKAGLRKIGFVSDPEDP